MARQPAFYRTIELKSARQIKFIKFAKLKTVQVPFGHCIEIILFSNESIKSVYLDTMTTLISTCPFVIHVNQLPIVINGNGDYATIPNSHPYWKRLMNIPLSYTRIENMWMDRIDSLSRSYDEVEKKQIQSVEIDLGITLNSITTATTQNIKMSRKDYNEMVLKGDKRHDKLILIVEDYEDCKSPKRYNDIYHHSSSVSFTSYSLDSCYQFNEETLESIS
ncbi:unnamed protein product [Cunninghamella blakesleeana]